MTQGSLYTGIGGWLLAGRWAGIENIFTCEIDKFCNKIVDKNFPEIPKENRHYDIKETDFTKHAGRIDILTTSDPCQPFSFAGKRGGTTDDRFLWPFTIEAIRAIKPAFVVFENVPGFISMAFETVASDLEAEGYTVESFIIPACAVGAWHRRDRLWIIAYNEKFGRGFGGIEGKRKNSSITDRGLCSNVSDSECEGLQRQSIGQMGKSSKSTKGCEINSDTTDTGTKNVRERENAPAVSNGDKTIADTNSKRRCSRDTGREDAEDVGQFSGSSEFGPWDVEPNVGGGSNGLPLWLHRHIIKGYGQEESKRRTEVLRKLWDNNVSQTIWQVIGGFNRIQKSEVLFALVCEYEKNPNQTRLLLEGKKTFKGFVRSLWEQEKITGSSCRPKNKKQHRDEYPDPLQTLSRLLAHNLQENWHISSWEDGIPRVESGIINRVDRLKSLGNAIVPQIAYVIFEAIKQVNDI